MAHNVKEINHAQFADDTLLLGGASIISAGFFKRELDIYNEVSGNMSNLQKSKIFGWNCTIREVAEIARVLGMDGTIS